jgi:hypothetical protein
MQHVKRLLKSLQFPFWEELNFLSSRSHLIILVCWLEDTKIRGLEVSDRAALKVDSAAWEEAFRNYLAVLNCPFIFEASTLLDCVDWLVSYAVSLEYSDKAEKRRSQEEFNTRLHDLAKLLDISQERHESNTGG